MREEMSCGDEEKNGLTNIMQRITITAYFSQDFKLRKFPFDEQKIEFILRYWMKPYCDCEREGKEVVEKEGRLIFYEDYAWKCRVKKDALKHFHEWSICKQDPNVEHDELDTNSTVSTD